jgi:hypothetical protein
MALFFFLPDVLALKFVQYHPKLLVVLIAVDFVHFASDFDALVIEERDGNQFCHKTSKYEFGCPFNFN